MLKYTTSVTRTYLAARLSMLVGIQLAIKSRLSHHLLHFIRSPNMSTSFSLRFLTILFLSTTLAFGQTQRPNPNLRFCGAAKNEGYVPEKVCSTNFRDMVCVDFADGASDPQFCSMGVCAIEAGEDGLAAIDSRIYNQIVLVGYLYKPEQVPEEVMTKLQNAFEAWETWKECVARIYVMTLKAKNVKKSLGLKSPEIRATKEKLEDMANLLTSVRLAFGEAKAIGKDVGYRDVFMSQVLEILSVEEDRLAKLGEYFKALADDITKCTSE